MRRQVLSEASEAYTSKRTHPKTKLQGWCTTAVFFHSLCGFLSLPTCRDITCKSTMNYILNVSATFSLSIYCVRTQSNKNLGTEFKTSYFRDPTLLPQYLSLKRQIQNIRNICGNRWVQVGFVWAFSFQCFPGFPARQCLIFNNYE